MALRFLVPFYHLVSNNAPAHIRHLYLPKSENEFERDLDFLLRHYVPLSLEELEKHINADLQLKKPGFHLTFDDGLSECFDPVFPILLKKGIPATFFLNAAFVNNQGLFYRYKVSLLLDHLQQNPHKAQHVLREFNLSDSADIKAHLLSLGYADTPAIDALAQKLGIDFEAYLQTNKPYMTQAQILAMHAQGFTFGAHSVDHPYMHLLSEAAQMEQFTQSIVQLKNLLCIPIRSFAFPFTDHGVRGATITNMHKTRLIHLSFGTSGIRPDKVQGHVQRFSLEHNRQPARQLILKEKWKAAIRTCLGTNTLKANR